MVMKKTAGLMVALCLVGATAPAFAEESKTPHPAPVEPRTASEPSAPELLFAASDANHDGVVTYGEFANVARSGIARRVLVRFHELDRNHDGRVSRSEVNLMSAERFARFDVDHDGFFTVRELSAAMTRELDAQLPQVYARLDVNHDGRFTVAELTPAKSDTAPQNAVALSANKTGKKLVVAKAGPSSVQ